MLDKLNAFERAQKKSLDAMQAAGASPAMLDLMNEANDATNALLREIVEVVGQLDVDAAEQRAGTNANLAARVAALESIAPKDVHGNVAHMAVQS